MPVESARPSLCFDVLTLAFSREVIWSSTWFIYSLTMSTILFSPSVVFFVQLLFLCTVILDCINFTVIYVLLLFLMCFSLFLFLFQIFVYLFWLEKIMWCFPYFKKVIVTFGRHHTICLFIYLHLHLPAISFERFID